tara:strand:- start:2285 stop:2572 length:288 start_codon:yes stop_codon:yes gene_type:complete
VATRIDIPIGVGIDTEADEYAVAQNQNIEMENLDIRTPGKEVKRSPSKFYINSNELGTNQKISNLFFWVEDNLLGKRAWITYDSLTGKIKIKEGK